jgi:tetratricopeptide (TPR) repeat protein
MQSQTIQNISHSVNINLTKDSKSPNSVTAYHNRAQNYYVLGKIEEAVKDYTSAIDICQDNNFKKELYSLRAKCYAKLKKTDLAQKDLQKAGDESDNKDAAEAAKHMASQFYNDKEFDKAIECFTKCLKHEPNNYLIYYNRAMCHKQLKKNEDAIYDFEKCIDLNNEYIMAHIMLGRVYTSKNQIEKAIKAYSNSLKIKDNSAIYFDRGCLYNQLQDYDKAIKDFTKCCDIDGSNSDSFYNRGSIYHRQFKEYDLALSDYNKVLTLNSKDIDVLLDRAMLHYQMENDEKAKDDFDKIFKIDSKHERAKQIYERMFGDN